MAASTPLQQFVAAELSRMPALIERVRRSTVDALRRPIDGLPAERMQRFDCAAALEQHAGRWCHGFVTALTQRVQGESAAADAGRAGGGPGPRGLSLLNQAAHDADIEIARASALIAGATEWELRELQTFTSALCGLPFVSIGSNPFQPDAFANALWLATEPLAQAGGRAVVLHAAAGPLAEVLRTEFAAACTRLETQGVQPSLFRTAVHVPAGPAGALAELLDSTTADLGGGAAVLDAATARLLASLFDAVARNSRMHPALAALTGSVRSLALGLAARDARLLEDASHPLWQWLDRFAYQSATHPHGDDPQLVAWASFAAELVAGLQATPLPDRQDLRDSLDQLDAYAGAQFNMQVQLAAADIAALDRDAPGTRALSIASMDTVPAELLDANRPAETDAQAAAWLDAQTPGGWYRLFLRGRWTVLRLLWHSDAGTRWLFASAYPQRDAAFDRASLVRLRTEGLIRPFVERSIVVRAAESVRRRLADPRQPSR